MDALTISIRGSIPVIMRGVVVNPLGEIVLPSIGNVKVLNFTITEARRIIESEVSKYYQFDDVTLTLDSPRPVAVHLAGESPRPGVQFVPFTTRVDKVILSNILTMGSRPVQTNSEENDPPVVVSSIEPAVPFGLSNMDRNVDLGDSRLQRYSLRNIRIEHSDGSVTRADILGYFYTGDLNLNPIIQSGDIIILEGRNEFSPRVSISGMVRKPFETEFRPGDTIAQLIRMAGGLNEYANTDTVHIYTENGLQYVTRDKFDTYLIESNSKIVIPRVKKSITNHSAWISGEVQNPGIYPIIEGVTTVKELIDMAGGLTEYAQSNGAFVDREGIWANVMKEQPDYDWSIGLINRTSDLFTETVNSIYLERAGSLSIIPVDVSNDTKMNEIILSDNDRLIIPKDRGTVAVIGQANNTGYYQYRQGLSALDYINMAGGTTSIADENRIFVIKAGSLTWYRYNETTIESGDMVYVDRTPRETYTTLRQYELSKNQQRNSTIQLIISGISTVAAVLTTILILNER
jgi:protein involved in polysaccharide export with SLBB domain